jgi:hypothetical protein
MKKIKLGFLFFYAVISLQAQESKVYNYFHPEYEDPNKKPVTTSEYEYNDNWDFLHDVALERGLFIPLSRQGLSAASTTTLHGSYFLNDKFGFRSGISYIGQTNAHEMYWRIPLLFAFRTGSIVRHDTKIEDYETFKEYLIDLLLNAIPKQFEFNAGFSPGYMKPDRSYYSPEHPLPDETITLRRRFAFSTDANMRIIFQIKRFGLYFNLGLSYLWTQNYIHSVYKPYFDEFRPAWFANLGFGLSFRF